MPRHNITYMTWHNIVWLTSRNTEHSELADPLQSFFTTHPYYNGPIPAPRHDSNVLDGIEFKEMEGNLKEDEGLGGEGILVVIENLSEGIQYCSWKAVGK